MFLKLMIVGGKRSREFSERVQSMFAVAADVLPGQALEDVERVAILGNIVERVLVLEAAWTLDGVSVSERDVRKRIGEMTRQARERGGYEQYVFMARSPDSARLCFEETYDICDRTAVVLYQAQATVVILYELVATDIAGLRPVLVYNPPITETEEPYEVCIDVSEDLSDGSEYTQNAFKRVIKKKRGATVQRQRGDSPWYAERASERRIGGNQMGNTGLAAPREPAPADYFNTAPTDKGFADESPLTPASPIALDLKSIFNGHTAQPGPFAPNITRPDTRIPVVPQVPVSVDMAEYIRSKAYRGFTLVFVGPGGSGSTFMSLGCAARIYAAGFSTAFIDGDLGGRSAQYLTRLGIQDTVFDAETQTRVLRSGFDLFGAARFCSADGRAWSLPKELTEKYDFIVVDVPIVCLQQAAQVLTAASRIAVTVEASTWGVGKAALALFGIPVDLERTFRERGRLIYNRGDKLAAGIFGAPAWDDESVKRKVEEIFGARSGLFTALPYASIVGSYASADDYWFSDKLFSDSTEGAALFDGVVRGILA
jgi:hypothetical protein